MHVHMCVYVYTIVLLITITLHGKCNPVRQKQSILPGVDLSIESYPKRLQADVFAQSSNKKVSRMSAKKIIIIKKYGHVYFVS